MKNVTDDRLRQMRATLLARGAELRERMRRVDADLARQQSPLPADAPDAAIAVENDEILEAIKHAASAELAHIDHALERLDAGTFAICEDCGGEIEAKRLTVVPYATRCGACAREA
jgi:DnaK suppressor protein